MPPSQEGSLLVADARPRRRGRIFPSPRPRTEAGAGTRRRGEVRCLHPGTLRRRRVDLPDHAGRRGLPEGRSPISRRCCGSPARKVFRSSRAAPAPRRTASRSAPGSWSTSAGSLNAVKSYDPEAGVVTVEPGVVLERLNARLKRDGLFFPVEPSTASRCTIGGMTGNNSCGARSIFYGKMVDNVLSVDAMLPDGERFSFGRVDNVSGGVGGSDRVRSLAARMLGLADRERAEIEARFPKVQRRVGGYNLDSLVAPVPNLAHLLVGSEGTLALTTAVTLKLSPLPAHRVMGVCHFPSFRAAMETTRHIVALGPVAVELVDNNILSLGADIPLFRQTLAQITKGKPNCLLLVEFAGEDRGALLRRPPAARPVHGRPRLPGRRRRGRRCGAAAAGLGGARGLPQHHDVDEGRRQARVLHRGLRRAARAPRRLHLGDHRALRPPRHPRHLVRARLGRLPARAPDPRHEARTKDVRAMREIAEAACELVRRFKGSHSGEHGDGISRSEFHPRMFGERLIGAFEEVKDAFDPESAAQPRQDRPPLPHGRPRADALSRGLRGRRAAEDGARLVGMGRLRRRRRDVQQQRHLPQARRRHHVPVLPGDARRAAPDARARQFAPACDLRPARPGRLHLARDEGDARPLRLLQGLPARVPDRRRHGQDEDRVPAPLS